MWRILESLGEILTRLVKHLVIPTFPEETIRDVVYLSLVGYVGGSSVPSVMVKKFCLREFPHFWELICFLRGEEGPLNQEGLPLPMRNLPQELGYEG